MNPSLRPSAAAFADTKPHYELLNGLRGVAALMVVWYHIFEGYATSPVTQRFNHGYLAVDFFFILSGFVMGYAYDDRLRKGTLSLGNFFKRRLIRLHPLVILGALLGVVSFLLQGGVRWDGTKVALSMVLLSFLMHLFMIPAASGAGVEIRGFGEMFPLNGPSWSLFFEYIGNILYGFFLHRLPTKWLGALAGASGVGLLWFALGDYSGVGNLGSGWSLAGTGFVGGMLRLLFAYTTGLLLARLPRSKRPIKGAFWYASAAIIIVLSMPHIGGGQMPWLNGLYDALCIILLFPLLVYIGVSAQPATSRSERACRFLGDLSYPLYIAHYPIMYYFYAWLWRNEYTFAQTWPVVLGVYALALLVGYLALKLYDIPVRRKLTARLRRSK